ncbi:hypothetical protein LLG95_13640 [bacterium]|nr:hypothetical protein [bacterium]
MNESCEELMRLRHMKSITIGLWVCSAVLLILSPGPPMKVIDSGESVGQFFLSLASVYTPLLAVISTIVYAVRRRRFIEIQKRDRR